MKEIRSYLNKYINIRMGLAGALIMGVIVFFINLEHGWLLASTAGAKQWLYTFFFGGVIIKLLEQSLTFIKNPFVAIPVSVILVSTITSFIVYLVHSLKGTPEPFLSTVPTIIFAPPGFLILAFKFRNGKKKPAKRQ